MHSKYHKVKLTILMLIIISHIQSAETCDKSNPYSNHSLMREILLVRHKPMREPLLDH